MTIYMVAPALDAAARRAVLSRHLGDHAPCMTLVYVAALATPDLELEIDAWASRSA